MSGESVFAVCLLGREERRFPMLLAWCGQLCVAMCIEQSFGVPKGGSH